MKFSESTLTILKNFAEINESIHFKEGNRVVTMHPQRLVLAEAIIEETIPLDCTIYRLNNLLAVTNLVSDQDFDCLFKKDRVVIKAGNRTVSSPYADPSCFFDPYQSTINLPEVTAKFTLEAQDFNGLKRAAMMMRLPHIVIKNTKEKIILSATDASNSSVGSFDIELDNGTMEKDFSVILPVSNLRMLVSSYSVMVAGNLAYFVNTDREFNQESARSLKYWSVLESTTETA